MITAKANLDDVSMWDELRKGAFREAAKVRLKANLDGLPPRLRRVVARAISDIDNISQLIAAGFITPDEWQREMEALIARFHQTAAIAGKGDSDISELENVINGIVSVQNEFLANFTADIRGDEWIARYAARAQMYGSAIKQSYWQGDIIRQAGQPLPLPAMPAEGTQCLSNCKCAWRIVRVAASGNDAPGFDAFWERHVKDSCQTCLERERLWSPIRIRGGELLR